MCYHRDTTMISWPGACLSLEVAGIGFPRHGGTFWQLLTETALVALWLPKKTLRRLGVQNALFGRLLAIINVFLNKGSEQLRISAALTEDESQYAEMIHLSSSPTQYQVRVAETGLKKFIVLSRQMNSEPSVCSSWDTCISVPQIPSLKINRIL